MHGRQQSRSRSNLRDKNHLATSRSNLAHVAPPSTYCVFTTRLHGTNNQRSTRRRIMVVSANDPPRVGTTDSEEVHRTQANANCTQRRAEEQRQAVPPCARDLRLECEEAGLPTFNSPRANLGAALACLQQADPSPEAEVAMAYVRVATTLVEDKSAASKSAASTSSRHSRSRSNRPAHSRLPTIQEEVNQPRVKVAPAVDLHANLDKNRHDRDARGNIG
jgi:hypothetical protein